MSSETAPQSQIKVTWLAGTAAAFVIFVAIGAYSSRMTWDYPTYDQQRADVRYQTLRKVQSVEQSLIMPVDTQGRPTAEWIDQDKGIIRIPIEEAMAKEVDTLKAKPTQAGAAIAGVAPAASAPASSSSKPQK
jgi:hypothetical protein